MFDSEIEKLVIFCRSLRDHGLAVTPAEVVAAVTAYRLIDTNDREEVFLSLRSVLTTRVEDFSIFEELFELFWTQEPGKPAGRNSSGKVERAPAPSFAKYARQRARLLSRELGRPTRRGQGTC